MQHAQSLVLLGDMAAQLQAHMLPVCYLNDLVSEAIAELYRVDSA
jgi:hypothetical protein